MHDTKRSDASINKRIYITIYRKSIKAEKGLGKCIDATIYFQTDGRNVVRNIKHHHLFRSVFTHLHLLDSSLSGQSALPLPERGHEQIVDSHLHEDEDKAKLLSELKQLRNRYTGVNEGMSNAFSKVATSLSRCLEEFELLDVEERHQIKRMVLKEIPELLTSYQSLTPVQRNEMEDNMILAFEKMNRFLQKIIISLENNRIERLNHLLRVNKMRYDDES